MSRTLLQVMTGALAFVPVVTGCLGLLYGARLPIYARTAGPLDVVLDSNLRFFAGLWLSVGIATFWAIPEIERQTTLVRFVCGMILLGGIGRLISMLAVGLPTRVDSIVFGLLELTSAPLIVVWQHRVAQSYVANARVGEQRVSE